MQLILTHEQADFDALASLFGASLLDERSTPVLPRRLNRNVRSFITLYGADFSFVDPRDLPPGKVESVTLVDTQSLITLKGMGVENYHLLRETGVDDIPGLARQDPGMFIQRLRATSPPHRAHQIPDPAIVRLWVREAQQKLK